MTKILEVLAATILLFIPVVIPVIGFSISATLGYVGLFVSLFLAIAFIYIGSSKE